MADKIVIVLGTDTGDRDALVTRLREALEARTGIECIRVSFSRPGAAGPLGGFVEAWGDRASLAQLPPVAAPARTYGAFIVDPIEEKGIDLIAEYGESVKVVGALVPYRDLSLAATRQGWDEHVPHALRIHFGMSSYTRNWVTSALPHSPQFFGFAMLRFPSARAVEEEYFVAPESESRKFIQGELARFVGIALRTEVQEQLLTRD